MAQMRVFVCAKTPASASACVGKEWRKRTESHVGPTHPGSAMATRMSTSDAGGCPIRRRIIALLSVPLDRERGLEALRPLQPRSIASTLQSRNSRRVSADRPRRQSLACPSRHKAVRARPAGHDGATAWTTTLPTAPPTRSHSFLTAVVPGTRRAKTIGPPPHRLIEAAAHMLAVRLKCLSAGLRQGDKGAVVS